MQHKRDHLRDVRRLGETRVLLRSEAYLESGQPGRAIELGTQALGLFAGSDDAGARGDARFVIARALGAVGRDRAPAIELATQARADYVEAKATDKVAAVDRLVAQAPP